MAGAGAVICGIIFMILIGLIIGSVILRCACWIYNKMVGASGGRRDRYRDEADDYRPRRSRSRDDEEEEGDEDDEEEEDDDRPRLRRRSREFDPDAPGVPEPSTGKAMGIIALNWLIGTAISVVLGLVMGGGLAAIGRGGPGAVGIAGMQMASSCVQLVAGFLILSGLLTAMLPTKFGRACAVSAITYVILIALAAVIIAALLAVGIGLRAGGGFR